MYKNDTNLQKTHNSKHLNPKRQLPCHDPQKKIFHSKYYQNPHTTLCQKHVFLTGVFDWKSYKTRFLTRTTVVAKSVKCLSGRTSRLQQVDYGLFCWHFVPYARSQGPFGTSIGTALGTSSVFTTYSHALLTNISKQVVPTVLKIVTIYWLYLVNA